jgi:hypothetical protein
MIGPGTEARLEKLIKMLSSNNDGEVIAAARAIQRTLSGAGSDVHELAERISGGKLSEAEMRKIYDAAYEDGKNDAAIDKGFTDVAGPSWHQMATFCAERGERWLTTREREFVDDMVSWTARRDPTEKQGKWLHVLYVRLERLGRR